jgi:glucan 1,3-beta-glucosidase
MPTDPRSAAGVCASLGVASTPAPALPATATGGAGAGTIDPAFRSSYAAWPVTALSGIPNAAFLPMYTPNGTLKTLPAPTYTKPGSTATFDTGSGWFQASDNSSVHVPIQGCVYPSEYMAMVGTVPVPAGADGCQVGMRKRAEMPEVTSPP